MQILCRLSAGEGKSNWLHASRTLGLAIKPILDAQVANNRLYLSLHKVPPIYRSGIRYENEPSWTFQGEPVEEFALIPIVLARGWGDCDDIAPWRVAELQHHGEPAKIRIQWKREMLPNGKKGRKYFHIVVRRGSGLVEDPCDKLGMKER
jgi:hypothetical protein